MKIKQILLFSAIILSQYTLLLSQNESRIPTVAFRQQDLWHILDQYGKDMFKPLKLEAISGYSEGYFTIKKAINNDTILGFMNLKGQIATIEGAKYLGLFKNGFAHYATWYKGTEDIKYYGYVRNDGVQITKPVYLEATYFGQDGLAFVMNWEKRGYIDGSGKFVKEFPFGFGEAYSEGRAVVQDSAGKFGFINKEFKQIVPLIYDEAHDFSEGLARVNKGALFGYIDTLGIDFIPHVFVLATDFKEGRAFVARAGSMDSLRWAIIARSGRILTDYIYDQINDYSQGIAAVKKNGIWFFLDLWGNKFIDKEWKSVDSFVNGLAWAEEKDGKKRRGYIDVTGKFQFTIPKDAKSIIDLRLNRAAE